MAPAMSKEYARRFDVDALDIQTANAQFETGSSVRSLISYVVSVVLLLVAAVLPQFAELVCTCCD